MTGLLRISLALLLLLSGPVGHAQPADAELYAQGEKLFKGNCGACHKPDKDMTGPAVKGARERWDGQGDIYAWVKNSSAYLKTGNPYANKLFQDWKGSVMTANAISDEEIDAILYYADNYAPPAPPPPPPGEETASTDGGQQGSNWPWFVVIGLMLLVVVVSLGGVKRSLDNAVREAEGREAAPDLNIVQRIRQWAWNNKMAASFISLFLVVWVLVKLWDMAWVIGVYGGDGVPNYKPEQPIHFNHTLHAGKENLAIDCQYCHSGVEKSKHAGIPSANICMNCHKAVDAGKTTGTTEIAKIYKAVGWDAENQKYTGEEEPIRWVKVHNLPDHAYFNHEQHVAVGKLECQECHGPVDTEMDVVEQWAPLTMGWCITCHAEREVNMAGNAYYDEVQARLMETDLGHGELKKYLEDGKITVKELGGWECSKCHY